MKYFGFVLVFLLLFSPVLHAEDAYEIEWTDQFSKSDTGTQTGESIATDSNGNTYVTGFTTSTLDSEQYLGGAHAYIIKYNAAGVIQKGWIVGNKGAYLMSNDGGNTWDLRETAIKTKFWLREISFVGDLHGLIVGARGTIVLTEDGGENWEIISGFSYDMEEFGLADF